MAGSLRVGWDSTLQQAFKLLREPPLCISPPVGVELEVVYPPVGVELEVVYPPVGVELEVVYPPVGVGSEVVYPPAGRKE